MSNRQAGVPITKTCRVALRLELPVDTHALTWNQTMQTDRWKQPDARWQRPGDDYRHVSWSAGLEPAYTCPQCAHDVSQQGWLPVATPVHWSLSLVKLNRVPWTYADCHATPGGEPTAADRIKPGELVRTSYGDHVYDVVAVRAGNDCDCHRDHRCPPYFNLIGRDISKPTGHNIGYLNELLAVPFRKSR